MFDVNLKGAIIELSELYPIRDLGFIDEIDAMIDKIIRKSIIIFIPLHRIKDYNELWIRTIRKGIISIATLRHKE